MFIVSNGKPARDDSRVIIAFRAIVLSFLHCTDKAARQDCYKVLQLRIFCYLKIKNFDHKNTFSIFRQ